MKATPWIVMAILGLILGGGKIAAILNSMEGIIAIVVLGLVAFGILLFGKGFSYNAIGNNAKVVHNVIVEHHYNDSDTNVSMDEETSKWMGQ